MALIAQLTDPHLRDDGADPFHDPAQALRHAFAQIAAMDITPDAIVLTGDIIDRSATGYAHALPLLRQAPVPLWPMPGNHDDPAGFRIALEGWADFAPDHLSYTAPIADLQLVALDSTLPDCGAGLDRARLDWLAGVLGKSQKPILLALHHPPFTTGAPHLDKPGFQNADALLHLIERGGVRRIIAGHSHRSMQTIWAGCLSSTAPAIGHGLSLSLSGAQRHKPARMAPAFELHAMSPKGCVSHQIDLEQGSD
ncbi:MAG: phosphoesterase [Rhodobacteraceae bacterium]|nr:MAG: phosphoesterase [Paracoccaceae bacterium]